MFREVFGGTPPLPNPPPEGRPGLARALLAAGARTILPDMRGFGASEKPREKAAYENSAMARDVVALIPIEVQVHAGHLAEPEGE